ncbi:MAG TPA: hypothetical protein VH915_12995 [Pedococcus sp.]
MRRGQRESAAAEDRPRAGRNHVLPDFTHLPERVRPEDLVTTQDVDPGPDPRGGRDTETEFLLRNAGF